MKAAWDIGHFGLVFVLILINYACVGHFLYAFSYPDDFGTLFASVIAMIKMITGEIDYSDLTDAYGSTSVPFSPFSYLPVQMFYFGFFFIVVMILLNICECVARRAFNRPCVPSSPTDHFVLWLVQSSALSSGRMTGCMRPLLRS